MLPEPAYILAVWFIGAMWHYQREMRVMENSEDVREGRAGIVPFFVLTEAMAWPIVWAWRLVTLPFRLLAR